MGSYILKPSSESVYFITHSRKQVGNVQKRGGSQEWVGRITRYNVVGYGPTAKAAFEDVVARANRVQLCGKDDPEAARAALAKRNEQVLQAQRDQQPLVDMINEAARAAGLPPVVRNRVRNRRIRL